MKAAIPTDRKAALEKRGAALKKAYADARDRTRAAAAVAWDASPISTARLSMEIYTQIKDLDFSLVSSSGNVSGWPNRLWRMENTIHWLGGSGGEGVGYGAPAAVGGALGNRDIGGRFSVNIQSDGDLMYAPGVLWTAARHKIPILSSCTTTAATIRKSCTCSAWPTVATAWRRSACDRSPIGTSIENPDIDFAGLAKSMGYWTAGPIKDPDQLGPTIKRAVEVVKAGEPALIDVGRSRGENRIGEDKFMNMRRVMFALAAVAAGLALGGGDGFAASAEKGKQLFLKNGCWQCHGEKGQGGVTGFKLAPDPIPFETLQKFVRTTNRDDAALSGSDPVERRSRGHLRLSAVDPERARRQEHSAAQPVTPAPVTPAVAGVAIRPRRKASPRRRRGLAF